jgi:hypothetical protein
MTWKADVKSDDKNRLLRIKFFDQERQSTFAETLSAWQNDESFRQLFTATLTAAPFVGFRWECPPITLSTASNGFECVLLKCDSLERTTDPKAFAGYFDGNKTGSDVAAFPSLGGDALLVVPRPITKASPYGHLAAFLRGAPEQQIHQLWQRVAVEFRNRLSEKPLWLSTAGMGVAWLHVRLDSRPKYYGHDPYCEVG